MELAAPFPPGVRGQSISAVSPGQSGLDCVIDAGDESDAIWERTIQPEELESWKEPEDWADTARGRSSRSGNITSDR